MIQIEIFVGSNPDEVQSAVNRWLKRNYKKVDIVNITTDVNIKQIAVTIHYKVDAE